MSLVMKETDIGYSQKGMQELIEQVKSEYGYVASVADKNSPRFRALKMQICNYWAGEDCEAFIKDLESAATALVEKINSYSGTIVKQLENYQTNFGTFQSNNYKSGTVTIKK